MREVHEIEASLKNLALIHGNVSEVVAKEKSLLALALLEEDDPDFDRCLSLLQEASSMLADLEIEEDEVGLDVQYRCVKVLESRATSDEQDLEVSEMFDQLYQKRQLFDERHTNNNPREPPAPLEEETDSTMCYYDASLRSRRLEGSLQTALQLMEKCIKLRRNKFGERSAALATPLLGFADLLREAGSFDRARECIADALAFSIKTYGRKDLKIAKILNSLGNLQRICTDFEGAEEHLLEALAIRRELLGNDDPSVAASLNNLAELYREQGQLLKAIDWHKQAIGVFERSVGNEHPGTVNAKGNYAVTLHRLAQHSAADGDALLNAAIDFMRDKGFEKEHPWLQKFGCEYLLNEARQLAQAKEFERSIELYNALIARKQSSLEKNIDANAQTEVATLSLSSLEMRSLSVIEFERFEAKLQWTQSLLDKCQFSSALQSLSDCEVFASNHISYPPESEREKLLSAQLLVVKAQLARVQGNFNDALKIAQNVINLHESNDQSSIDQENDETQKHLKDKFPIAKNLLFLSDLHCELGNLKEAESYALEATKLLQRQVEKDNIAFGQASLETAIVLSQSLLLLARLRLEKGAYEYAFTFLDRALELINKHGLTRHAVYAEYLFHFASLESIKGSHDQVLSLLEQALVIQNDTTGKDHLFNVQILCKLILTQSLTATFDTALQRIEEASAILQRVIERVNPKHPSIALLLVAKGVTQSAMGQRADAKATLQKAIDVYVACYTGDDSHLSLVPALVALGQIAREECAFKVAISFIGKAQTIHSRYFVNNNTIDHLFLHTKLSFFQLRLALERGVIEEYDFNSFEKRLTDSIASIESVLSQFKGDRVEKGGSTLLAEILLCYARFSLLHGKLPEVRILIGKSGAEMKRYFQSYDAPALYLPLMMLGEWCMETDRFRDAKVLFSFSLLNAQLLLGPKCANHALLIEIISLSIENMRRLGYFHDAVDALQSLSQKIHKGMGAGSVEMIKAEYLEACLLRDRQKFAKAEIMFSDIEKRWTEIFSKVSLYYLSYLKDNGKCFLMQQKNTLASQYLNAAQELAFRFKFAAKKVPIVFDINADIQYLQIGSKPNELQAAVKTLKESVLTDANAVFGANHTYTLHIKGRVAMFMNALQKGAGRKALFDVLKNYDELKPFPLPFDHPFVSELGGYEKASSKDRLSRNITEYALYQWCELTAEDYYDPNAAVYLDKYSPLLPKSIFVDMKNNDPLQWGDVHYYGNDVDTNQKRGRPRVRIERDNASRSPSPSGGGAVSVKASEKVSRSASGPAFAELQDQLAREITARKAAEDAVVQLKYDKHNLEETLEEEKLKVLQANKELEKERAQQEALQAQMLALAEQMSALQAKLSVVEAELAEKIRKEEEEAAKRRAEQELAEAEAKLRAERLSQQSNSEANDENAATVVVLTPEQLRELEAAEFLLFRAIKLHEEGWYRKAVPIFDEAFLIRERILGMEKIGTIEVLRWRAVNHRAVGNLSLAQDLFSTCLSVVERVFGKENEAYWITQLESLQCDCDVGRFVPTRDAVALLSKSVGAKITALETENKSWQEVLTRAEEHRARQMSHLHQQEEDESVMEEKEREKELEAQREKEREEEIERLRAQEREARQKKRGKKLPTEAEQKAKEEEEKKKKKRETPPTPEEIDEANTHMAGIAAQLRGFNALLGRVLTLQAAIALEEGKYAEAKAHIERGQALLSKALGLNDWFIVQALIVKTRIFVTLARAKESISTIEQAILIARTLLKAREKDEKEREKPALPNENAPVAAEKDINEYEHPLLGDCFLLFSRALLVQNLFTDAKKRLIRARILRTKYFEAPELAFQDVRLLELDCYDAVCAIATCEYFHARDILTRTMHELDNTLTVCLRDETVFKKHLLYLLIYQQLAVIDIKTGDYLSARESVDCMAKELRPLGIPNNFFAWEESLLKIEILHATGDFFAAKNLIENTIESAKESAHKEHPLLMSLFLHQGDHFAHHNESDAAENIYEKVCKYSQPQSPHGHSVALEAIARTVQLFIKTGKPLEAKKKLQTMQFMAKSVFGFAVVHEIFARITILQAKIALLEIEMTLNTQQESNNGEDEKKDDSAVDNEAEKAQEETKGEITTAEKGLEEVEEDPDLDLSALLAKPVEQNKNVPVEAVEEEEEEEAVPEFDRSAFLAVADTFASGLRQLSAIYTPPSPSSQLKEAMTAADASQRDESTKKKRAGEGDDDNDVLSLSAVGPPLLTFVAGLLGTVHLREYVAQQLFIQSLSSSQREKYFTQLQMRETNRDKRKAMAMMQAQTNGLVTSNTAEPSGKAEIEKAIKRLQRWECMQADHAYIVELQAVLSDLVLQFDDMQMATITLQRANRLKREGRFSFAEKLYDEAFILFFKALGAHAAQSSLLIARLLCEKGENSRYLARKVDYVKSLHVLSIRVYRQSHGDEQHFDAFVAHNLLQTMQLLLDQHQFDDALVMFRSLQDSLLLKYPALENALEDAPMTAPRLSALQEAMRASSSSGGENDTRDALVVLLKLQIVQAKAALALYQYDDVLTLNQRAMEMIKALSLSAEDNEVDKDDDEEGENAKRARGKDREGEEEMNHMLTELLIRVYLNEIAVNDILGNFAKAEEFVQQIQTLLEHWKKQQLTEKEKESMPSKNERMTQSRGSTRNGNAQTQRNRSGSPARTKSSSSPQRTQSRPRSGRAQSRKSDRGNASNSNSQKNLLASDYFTANKSKGHNNLNLLQDAAAAAAAAEKEREREETSLSAAYRIIQADVCVALSEHCLTLHRFQDAQQWSDRALESRISLFNRVKKTAKSEAKNASNTMPAPQEKKNKFDPNVEPEWTREKTEEVRSAFMLAMEALLHAGRAAAVRDAEKKKSDNEGSGEDKPQVVQSSARGKNIRENDPSRLDRQQQAVKEGDIDAEVLSTAAEIARDFDSTVNGEKENEKEGENDAHSVRSYSSSSPSSLLGVSLSDFVLAEDKFFLFRKHTLSAHVGFAEAMYLQARIFYVLGELSRTKEALEIATPMLQHLYPRMTLYKCKLSFLLAQLKFLQNQLDECRTLHLQLLEKRLSLAGSAVLQSLDLAESYTALAQLHVLRGDFEDAMQYVNDALRIERRLFQKYAAALSNTVSFRGTNTAALMAAASTPSSKDSHYRIQSLLVLCAEILFHKACFQDALSLLDSCLTTQKRNFAQLSTELHLSIAQAMTLKARTQLALSQGADAVNGLQLARSIYLVLYGEKHFELGLLALYTAQTMRELGRLRECQQQLDLAVTTIRTQLGKYHFFTILALLEIGINFLDLAKYTTAQHVLERAIYLLRKSLGKDHLSVAVGYNALAELYLTIGRYEDVPKFLEDALYITRKAMGSDRHPLVARVMSNLQELKATRGVLDEAVQGLDDAVALMKILFNTTNHFQIARTQLALARTLLQQGRIYEAKAQFDRVHHAIKTLSPGADHVLLYEAQFGVAQCLLCVGRLDQAKALFERCLQAFQDWKGPAHPAVAAALHQLGDIYNTLYRLQTAEKLLAEAYTIRLKALRECNSSHVEIIKNWLSFAENLRLRGLYTAPANVQGADDASTGSAANESTSSRLLISDAMKLKIAKDKEKENATRPRSAASSRAHNARLAVPQTIAEESEKKNNRTDVDDEEKEELAEVDAILSQAEPRVGEEPSSSLEKKMFADSVGSASLAMLGEQAMSQEQLDAHQVPPSARSGERARERRDDDEESAPTVAISAIEHLDRDNKKDRTGIDGEQGEEDGEREADDANLPGGAAHETRRFLQDEANYKAMPLLERALSYLLTVFHDDHSHPLVMRTKHLLAETHRGQGDFEKSLSMHESLFAARRKTLGDTHYDTISSLLSIGELLRVLKRVFSSAAGKPSHSSAHGAGQDALRAQAQQVGTGGVSLLDHLTSLMVPVALPPRAKTPSSSSTSLLPQGLHGTHQEEEDDLFGDTEEEKLRKVRKKALKTGRDWVFLTKNDCEVLEASKKPKPLVRPRGFMGYQFPPPKKDSLEESTGNMLRAINTSNRPSSPSHDNEGSNSSPLQDPKKCMDLAINLLKKLLASDEFGISLRKNELFDHPFVAIALYNKAEVARLRGEGMQALRLLEQALAMRRRLFRAHHPSVADCLFSMAELLRADQRYGQALPIYDKAREIRIETFGERHFSVAEVENSVALLYIAQGDFPKAQEVLLHALDLCELSLRPEHPSTAFACNNHASLLQAMGEYAQALAWYRKALQIKQKIFGDTHPEIAATMNNMGLLYKAEGKLDEALICYEKALAIQKQALGTNHPDIASTLNNFAAALAVQEGRKFEAKEFFKQSLAIRTLCFGNENTLVATTMNNFAGLLYSLGETTSAHDMFQEALRLRKKLLGEEHPQVAESLHNLGYFYLSQQQFYEAKLLYEQAMNIRKKVFGPEHLLVAATALHYSNALAEMNEWPIAAEVAQQSYEIRQKALGESHRETVASKKSLERILKKFQKFQRLQASSNKRSTTPGRATSSSGQRPKAAKDLPPRSPSPTMDRAELGFETDGRMQ